MSLTIRPARPGEAGLVLAFIQALAAYEKLAHEVEAGEATSYSSGASDEAATTDGGSLASDEALQALREKLTGGN